jgi:hypothetical protein
MGLGKSLIRLLEEVKVGGDLPREVHLGLSFHPDLKQLAKSRGPKFLIRTVHSVPFFADPDLKKNEVRVVTATGEEKVVKI